MHKRNIGGILKYGERTYKKATGKLQSGGGFASYAKGYNWREDPYELMLLQNKARGQNRSSNEYAASGLGGATKASKYKPAQMKDLPALKEGLSGSRKIANQEYYEIQLAYYKAVENNGNDWVRSDPGQQMYQEVINWGIRKSAELKDEKDQFDTSYSEYKDKNGTNVETIALSSTGAMLAKKKGDATLARISMEEYLKDIEEYTPLTVSDFVYWKQNVSGINKAYINEFLDRGAISPESVYETYVKSNEDRLDYAIVKEKLIRKAKDGKLDTQLGTVQEIRQAVINVSKGKNAYAGLAKESTDNGSALIEAAKSVYTTILGQSSNNSKLLASLRAEVLANNDNIVALKKMTTFEEKSVFLTKQVSFALLNKLIDKSALKAGSKDAAAAGDGALTYSAPMTGVNAAGINAMLNVDTDIYAIEYNQNVDGKKRVIKSKFTLSQGLGSAQLNIPTSKNATDDQKIQLKVAQNIALGKVANVNGDSLYLEDGTSVLHELFNNDEQAYNNWIGGSVVLAPGTDARILWVPTVKDKPIMSKYSDIARYQFNSRENFVAVMKKVNEPISVKANELYPGDIDKEEYVRMYKEWLDSSADASRLEKVSNADKNNLEKKKAYIKAEAAKQTVLKSSTALRKVFNNGKIMIQAFYMANIVSDDDKADLRDKHKTIVEKNNGFGANTLKKVTSGEYKKQLQEVADIDHWNWGAYNDHILATKILIKAKSSNQIAADADTETRKAALNTEIEDQVQMSMLKYNQIGGLDGKNTGFVIDLLKN